MGTSCLKYINPPSPPVGRVRTQRSTNAGLAGRSLQRSGGHSVASPERGAQRGAWRDRDLISAPRRLISIGVTTGRLCRRHPLRIRLECPHQGGPAWISEASLQQYWHIAAKFYPLHGNTPKTIGSRPSCFGCPFLLPTILSIASTGGARLQNGHGHSQ